VILPPKVTMRSGGYWLAGKTMLGRSDVLVALWDGQIARHQGLPIAWVHCSNRRAGTQEPANLGEEHGKVSFEGF
jgi:hypothetical protein